MTCDFWTADFFVKIPHTNIHPFMLPKYEYKCLNRTLGNFVHIYILSLNICSLFFCQSTHEFFLPFMDVVLFSVCFLDSPSDLPRVHEIKIETETCSMSKSEPSLNTAAAADESDKNGSGGSPPIPLKRPPADKRRKKSSKGSTEDGGSGNGSGKEVQMLLRR